MDPIHPWLDANEVRRLAEGLMTPAQATSPSVKDAGFDGLFIGYEANQPAPPQAAPLPVAAPLPSPEDEPPPLPFLKPTPPAAAAPAVETAKPVPAPGQALALSRLHRFRDWLSANFSATDVFILDQDGLVIFDESQHGRLHFLARSLALASRKPGAQAENVHVKIGAAATLQVIPVETPSGYFVLGAVVPVSLPPASIALVRHALIQVSTPAPERK